MHTDKLVFDFAGICCEFVLNLFLFACLESDCLYADGRLASLTEGGSPRNFSKYPRSLEVKTDIVCFELLPRIKARNHNAARKTKPYGVGRVALCNAKW